MKLHSPTFEKALRRAVKRTVRHSPELKRELRRTKKPRRNYSLGFIVRPAISIGLGMLVWNVLQQTNHAQTGVAVLSLWAFGLVFTHAQGLLARLFAANDLPALFLLPLPDGLIFRWELQKFLRSAWVSLLDLLAGVVAVAWFLNFSASHWLGAIAVALLSWAIVLSLGAFCAAYFPGWPYRLITTGFVLVLTSIFVGRTLVGPALIGMLDRHAAGINLLLPTGWAPSLVSLLLPVAQWSTCWLLLPIAALLWTVRNSLDRLGNGYHFIEAVTPEAPDLLPQPEPQDPANEPALHPNRLGPTAIEEIIQSRQFLAPQWPRLGWFEKRLWHWLTAREKALIEFAFPAGFALSRSWMKLGRNLCIAVLLGLAAGLLSPIVRMWLIGLGLFITFCHALALMLATGRAFLAVNCSGVNIPIYAGFGLGFREVVRVLFKCSVIQLPVFLPFAAIGGALIGWMAGLPASDGALHGLKAGWLVFSGRLIALVFGFSSGTNDSQRFRLRSGGLLLVMLGGVGSFLALGLFSFLVTQQLLAVACLIGALLDSYLLCRLYGWFYHTNSFDLMNLPRS